MTNTKQRLIKLEKTKPVKPFKTVVLRDAHEGGLAMFDGVEMTQAEAEAKAAAQPDNVLVIHVVRASSMDAIE